MALVLLWPPAHDSIRNSQFAIPVTACILWWMSSRRESVWRPGLLIALALTKPSLSLPFLIVPLMRRQWKALGVAASVHGLGLLALSAFLKVVSGVRIEHRLPACCHDISVCWHLLDGNTDMSR